jgi:hypothetical protein
MLWWIGRAPSITTHTADGQARALPRFCATLATGDAFLDVHSLAMRSRIAA